MKELKEQDYINAAKELGCEVASIKAVAEVESAGSGFLSDGQPKILFERHYFSRLTGGKYDKSYPDISYPKWGGYGATNRQHARLTQATMLDRNAALMSASWGKFQIMGEHWKKLGYSTLQEFINAMYSSEAGQLNAFVRYIKVFGLQKAIQNKDWKTFARLYNGANYAVNKYDVKMAQSYKKYSVN